MTGEEKIKKYLEKRAAEDELFRKNYEKPNKSVEECWKYICGEVASMAHGTSCLGFAEEEIYSMAVHYYDEDDIKIKSVNGIIKSSSERISKAADKVELTEEEKKEAHDVAIQQYQKRVLDEQRQKSKVRIETASEVVELTEEEMKEVRERAKEKYEKQCMELARDAEKERESKRAAKKRATEGEVGSLFG